MKVNASLIAGLIAVATTTATAAELAQVDLRPYLLISSHLEIPTLFEPDELTHEEQQQFITQGGAVFSSLAIQTAPRAPSSEVYRGVATAAQLGDLRNQLNSANIRAQRSCESDSRGSQAGYIDFTWYSTRGKRNFFRVVFARTGTSGLPPCREPLSRIISALHTFESEILRNPDTEILRTPL